MTIEVHLKRVFKLAAGDKITFYVNDFDINIEVLEVDLRRVRFRRSGFMFGGPAEETLPLGEFLHQYGDEIEGETQYESRLTSAPE